MATTNPTTQDAPVGIATQAVSPAVTPIIPAGEAPIASPQPSITSTESQYVWLRVCGVTTDCRPSSVAVPVTPLEVVSYETKPLTGSTSTGPVKPQGKRRLIIAVALALILLAVLLGALGGSHNLGNKSTSSGQGSGGQSVKGCSKHNCLNCSSDYRSCLQCAVNYIQESASATACIPCTASGRCFCSATNGPTDTSSDKDNCGKCGSQCSLAFATSGCASGACTIESCNNGHADCNSQTLDGCEQDLTSLTDCGGCGRACSAAKATTTCSTGACAISSCNVGWADCNNFVPDGCEVNLQSNATNCGACGHSCSLNHASVACKTGGCAIAQCNSGFGDCDGQAGNGCEQDLQTTAANCGTCGHVCSLPHATAACSCGSCVIGSCNPGYADCDGKLFNGCEVNVQTNVTNCGNCGYSCSLANAVPACSAGVCEVSSCPFGYGNCDGKPRNGCETYLQTNVTNCGVCGTTCSLPHASSSCTSGSCVIASCDNGYADCDAVPSTGCESYIFTNATNCGGCGLSCSLPHATSMCSFGDCLIASCDANYDDCDFLDSNGCESQLCMCSGSCGFACSLPNAVAGCAGGNCFIASCDTDYSDCDGQVASGCEVNLQTNLTNCGSCGHRCTARPHSTPACSAGSCAIASCSSGYADCDLQVYDGCEVNVQTNVTNCGSCGFACSLPHETPKCVGGACAIASCNPGYADCDNKAFNGCETNLQTNGTNCGHCGNVCGGVPHAVAACNSGSCTINIGACDPGWADCDGKSWNGCETFVQTNITNCGSCGHVCGPLPHATQGCVSGVCSIVSCNPGFGDCNHQTSDGCERSLQADVTNCGVCGHQCVFAYANATCTSGVCNMGACDFDYADCNHNAGDGCESYLQADVNNCGACSAACSLYQATPQCAFGECIIISCNLGYGDCDELPQNGCESNLLTNTTNCGVCGHACALPQAVADCVSGSCGIASCSASYQDCDGQVNNGCEVDVQSSFSNCGSCGYTCNLDHATPVCTTGACAISVCDVGFGDCDGLSWSGCEASLQTNVTNCGFCGHACPALPHATSGCFGGVCGIASCNTGCADCDHLVWTGCEVALQTNATNCGACNNVCSFPHATAVCSTGVCALGSCRTGYANCDGKLFNSCEVLLQTNTSNCGSCGHACILSHATASCSGGACVIASCNAGYGDCDNRAFSGCETNLQTNATNCANCGHACPALAYATVGCIGGSCVIASCNSGYADCDGKVFNGCEVNVQTNVTNCGACGHVCSYAHVSASCTTGACSMGACNSGYGDCDDKSFNGCEVSLQTNSTNCGTCGHVCSLPHATAACSGGSCVIASCNAGYGDCDLKGFNGCEVGLQTNATNCGTCGHVCSLYQATSVCTAGACAVSGCNTGFADCDGLSSNGCEADLNHNGTNCGHCGNVCGGVPHAVATCTSGSCSIGIGACDPGWADCDSKTFDGCETFVQTNITNCGSCGNVCTLAHATAVCIGGQCAVSSCGTGFGDCNHQASDGCETDLQTTLANCGVCGNVCSYAHASASCATGACSMGACNSGYGDCDVKSFNGCEVSLQTNSTNCGTCGHVCSLPHATAGCSAGTCVIASCNAGYGDCDLKGFNGCEVGLQTNATNCGTCGHVCSLPHATAACSSGSCVVGSCSPGYADCDGKVFNGCEVNVQTNVTNCGNCGYSCSLANAVPACSVGVCAVSSCVSNYGNCDGKPWNGCETYLQTNVTNCGTCGYACTLAHAINQCSGGACAIASCNSGWGDCDHAPGNGCELSLQTTSNCGACGVTCSTLHCISACTGTPGSCTISSCVAGYGDCDGLASTGCETNLQTSVTDCGSCGYACSYAHAGASCAGGSCSMGACNSGYGDCNSRSFDGCEVSLLTNATNWFAFGSVSGLNVRCSNSCGHVCGAVAHGTPGCGAGVCGIGSCNAGYGDCDHKAFDGCETALQTNATNCGTCGNKCTCGPLGTPVCSAGVCSCNCPGGDTYCGAVTGCVNLATDSSHCGTCTTVCDTGATCSSSVCKCTTFGNTDCGPVTGCVNLNTNAAHCGTCTNACDPGAVCSSGACKCSVTGSTDCGAVTGCVNLNTNANNCGSCGHACSLPQATPACSAGACIISSCNTNYGNCNNQAWDGCEVALETNTTNCGTCGHVCSFAHATPTCVGGACVMGACNTGYANCDGKSFNGCEVNLQTNLTNCGSCGHRCTVQPHSTPVCSSGSCTIASCSAGYEDCNLQLYDGCEVNVQTSVTNCGSCGFACSLPHATPKCVGGACAIANCNSGYADCDNKAFNGCETNLQTNVTNCGSCGHVCSLAHATAVCSGGACAIASCNSGYANCDNRVFSGCETNLQTNATNCGSCGYVCPIAVHALTSICSGGACEVGTCSSGYGDCDHKFFDGCETGLQANLTNCGSCGNVCACGPGAAVGCSASSCTCTCTGTTYCGLTTGCTNTNTDYNNCGSCAHSCVPGSTCSTGTCTCTTSGQTLCPTACVDTKSDNSNCGSCSHTCQPSSTCTSGICICNSGLSNCFGTCVNPSTDTNNCGTCGHVCPTGASCVSGSCLCPNGYTVCGTNPGSCANLQTDNSNCGTCSHYCLPGKSCVSGTCSCATGYTTCATGGCYNLQTDRFNCGTCGHQCAANQPTCSAGSCTGTCTTGHVACITAASYPSFTCVTGTNWSVLALSCVAECVRCSGTCSPACDHGAVCWGDNVCYCPDPQIDCGTVKGCVNIYTNSTNCGACGQKCASGKTCSSGYCV